MDFVLDSNTPYKMKELDLFNTCVKNSHDKLNVKKTDMFLSELAKTNMNKTLKHLHICNSDFDRTDLQTLCSKHGFKVSISSDDKYPSDC
jgi:hypothetical protein